MARTEVEQNIRDFTVRAERIAAVLAMFGVFGDRDNEPAMKLSRENFVSTVTAHALSATTSPLELDYPARGVRLRVITETAEAAGAPHFLSVTARDYKQKTITMDYLGLNKALKKLVPPPLGA